MDDTDDNNDKRNKAKNNSMQWYELIETAQNFITLFDVINIYIFYTVG